MKLLLEITSVSSEQLKQTSRKDR